MLTWDAMRTWSALEDQVSSEHAYNWYRNNLGINASARLFGLNDSSGGNYTKDSKKSKEYNAVNREYAQLGVEIEMYKESLNNPINDMQRKLRDIDRTNPNNFEDYNISMNTYAGLKKQQFDAIKEKASLIKNKHELLIKIEKAESDVKGGGGSGGQYSALTDMAHVLKGIGSMNTASTDPALMGTMDMDTYEGKMRQAQRFAVATGNVSGADSQHIGHVPEENVLSDYMKAVSKYGKDALDEVYCSNPESGFGYIKYVTPEGEEGLKEFSPALFRASYVDYNSHVVTDSTKRSYKVEEVEDIPPEIENAWKKIYPDGYNKLGKK